MLIEMLSEHFDQDLITASKQVCELEMVNVMGLLVSGPASAVVPQVYLGGAFNASDHRQVLLGLKERFEKEGVWALISVGILPVPAAVGAWYN